MKRLALGGPRAVWQRAHSPGTGTSTGMATGVVGFRLASQAPSREARRSVQKDSVQKDSGLSGRI